MFEFLTILLGIDLNQPYYKGDALEKAELERQKKRSDEEAIAAYQMQNETDPIKKIKMQNRLRHHITDFSDL